MRERQIKFQCVTTILCMLVQSIHSRLVHQIMVHQSWGKKSKIVNLLNTCITPTNISCHTVYSNEPTYVYMYVHTPHVGLHGIVLDVVHIVSLARQYY